MKLYSVPRNSRIKLVGDIKTPASPMVEGEEILNFSHVDGMYSYCTRDNGEVVHLAASTEVEVINKN
tara:strand:+ start:248 stop:448 length:201 start_codon:yes stop_codon:yes gene_type:complete